jgi:hypothetical protein
MPARVHSEPWSCTGLRAGVGQASGEETAAHATVVVERADAMAIADAPAVSTHGIAASAVGAASAKADIEPLRAGESGADTL